MQLLAIAAVLTVNHALVSAPAIEPIDQSSDSVIVVNVRPGARVDAYANGFWIGRGTARGSFAAIGLRKELRPGDQIIAVESFGNGTSVASPAAVIFHDYATYHYDKLRTGWNNAEVVLTQANVGSARFGQVFSAPVDGNVYAQPLFASAVAIPGQGTHDVVYAATENDSVYALDATTGSTLWKMRYANSALGYSPVPSTNLGCPQVAPLIGITSTPVIDRSTSTLYFVAAVKRVQGAATSFHQFLHAADLATGTDRSNSPVDIQASVMGPGRTVIAFDPKWELNRPGLLLSNGVLYLAFGSHCDLHASTAKGWLLAYSAATLGLLGAFNTAPGSPRGFASIWAGGFAPAADAQGAIYFATGNGMFDGNTGGRWWGDTVLKLSPDLRILDTFTPFDQAALNMDDQDLGGGGPMLLPPQAGAHPSLLVLEGKAPKIFLIDRDRMGGYTPGGPDRVLQELPNAAGLHLVGGPAYFQSHAGKPIVLLGGGQDHLKAFELLTSPMTGLMLTSQSRMVFVGEAGTIPAVTSNGLVSGTGVVWAVERASSSHEMRLTAFAADDLSRQLVNLPAGPWFNPGGALFGVPTVIGGRAYVGSANAVTAFGLR
jgi:hypothetical protein